MVVIAYVACGWWRERKGGGEHEKEAVFFRILHFTLHKTRNLQTILESICSGHCWLGHGTSSHLIPSGIHGHKLSGVRRPLASFVNVKLMSQRPSLFSFSSSSHP